MDPLTTRVKLREALHNKCHILRITIDDSPNNEPSVFFQHIDAPHSCTPRRVRRENCGAALSAVKNDQLQYHYTLPR